MSIPVNDEDQKPEKKGIEEEYLVTMENEFKWNFLQHPDLKATYSIGLLYNRVARQQQKELKTRGLEKKMRYLFDKLDKGNLLKIFAELNKVSFSVQTKTRTNSLGYGLIRSRAEELLGQFKGETTEEELSVAFMFGYDSVRRTWQRIREN